MKQHHLIGIGGICALALTFFGCWEMNSIRRLTDAQKGVAERIEKEALGAIHEEGDKTRTWLGAQVQDTRRDLVALVNTQADSLRRDAFARVDSLATKSEGQLNGIRADLDSRVDWLSHMADFHLSQATSVLNGQLGRANDSVALVAKAVPPVLEQSKALVQDAQDSLDDIYTDARGLVESSTAAMTGVAVTAEVVGKAAPDMAKSVNGIAADIHTATSEAVKPVPWYKKVGNIGYSLLILLSHFL